MSGYIARSADELLAEMLANHPAVLLTGPRATGKTTTAARLARSVVRLSENKEAMAFKADPRVGLESRQEPILVDEWQIVPETLATIKIMVDGDPKRGRFLVTGSVRGDLDSPTWPGTGRLVRLSMHGLIEREIEGRAAQPAWLRAALTGDVPPIHSNLDLGDYVERALRSGFPEPALELNSQGRSRWLSSYVDQLVTRDATEIEAGRDPVRLRRYLQALTLNSAGIVDDVTLFQAAQISKETARAYDRMLQNLLITDNIPAWTSNRLKRLSLAPKRYLVDPGLFVGVLGIGIDEVLGDGDLLGRVVESFVVAQIRAELALMTPTPRLHHLRTSQGRHEIDLVIEIGARRLVAIEIKSKSAPSYDDARHLRWLRDSIGKDFIVGIVFHTGPDTFKIDDDIIACPIAGLWS